MTPNDLINTYGLTDKAINRALHHVQPKTVAAYAAAIEAFVADDSAANFNACLGVERLIIREARIWRRALRWLDRLTQRAYFLGSSEERLKACEANGILQGGANDY